MGIFALAKIITDAEMERILRTIPEITRKERTTFWRTLIILGANMGLRCSETLNIRLNDIDFIEKTLIITKQKNKNNYQKVIIPDYVLLILKEHIKEYHQFILNNGNFLFFNYRCDNLHKNLSTCGVRKFMARLRKAVNLNNPYEQYGNRKFYPLSYHTFRHYYLTKVYKKTKDLQAAMICGRHSNTQVTLRYQHLDLSTQREIINKVYEQDQAKTIEIEDLKEEIKELKTMIKNSLIIPAT